MEQMCFHLHNELNLGCLMLWDEQHFLFEMVSFDFITNAENAFAYTHTEHKMTEVMFKDIS